MSLDENIHIYTIIGLHRSDDTCAFDSFVYFIFSSTLFLRHDWVFLFLFRSVSLLS